MLKFRRIFLPTTFDVRGKVMLLVAGARRGLSTPDSIGQVGRRLTPPCRPTSCHPCSPSCHQVRLVEDLPHPSSSPGSCPSQVRKCSTPPKISLVGTCLPHPTPSVSFFPDHLCRGSVLPVTAPCSGW